MFGAGPGRWTAAEGAVVLVVGYQLGVLMPAENPYTKHLPEDVALYPGDCCPCQRTVVPDMYCCGA